MAAERKPALLQGSLDMLILQALKKDAKHGYAIARHLKEVSQDFLNVEEGSLYPALYRLEQRGWITSYWGTSDSNRRAKYYELSPLGRGQLKAEAEAWRRMSTAIDRVMGFQT
ncbi:MAG TPA: PadR family transcriptional regulator [Planctomycetaceae bacterium]|nr:PadR family transcriptional regulator [Planctomycetaceae bacterium]